MIENKIAASGLVNLELEDFYPSASIAVIDIKDQLWQGLVLREKEFRNWVNEQSWENYSNKFVAVTCSADAIVPKWAFMLIVSQLHPYTTQVFYGDENTALHALWQDALSKIEVADYSDKRVLVKGCAEKEIPETAYMQVVQMLQPVAKSIMFGEACSSVPVFKK